MRVTKKKWNRIISFFVSFLIIVLGILCFFNAQLTADISAIVAGSFLIIIGSGITIFALISSSFFLPTGLMFLNGLVGIVLGALLCYNTAIFTTLIGIYIFINAMTKISEAFELKSLNFKKWWINLVFGILLLAFGITLFFAGEIAETAVSYLIGTFLIIMGVFNYIDLFIQMKIEKRVESAIDSAKSKFNDAITVDIIEEKEE